MRKIKTVTKLSLNSETIQLLKNAQLAEVVGGSYTTTYNAKGPHTYACATKDSCTSG